jgi:hypothetical protein
LTRRAQCVLVSFVQTQPTAPDRPQPNAAADADAGSPCTPNPHRAILDDLIDLGADFARDIRAQARTQPDAIPELATAFDQVTRGVRRAILLAQNLDTPRRQAAVNRTLTRKKIIRRVEDDIGGVADSPEHAETLREALRERMDEPDLDDDIANRPVGEILDEIIRDLGMADDCGMNLWLPRGPAELAALRELAAKPTPPEKPAPPGPTAPPRIHWPVPDQAGCDAIEARFAALAKSKVQKKALLF